MSWFSELTSKAEALLVKLDQDAAQALRNPEGLLNSIDNNHTQDETPPEIEDIVEQQHQYESHEPEPFYDEHSRLDAVDSSTEPDRPKPAFFHASWDSPKVPIDDYKPPRSFTPNVRSPTAADIRASINRSLEEYTIQTPSLHVSSDPTVNSYYDNQPLLIRQSENDDVGHVQRRLHSPESFSIDVPPEDRCGQANRLSTFYLHKIINKLGSTSGRTGPIVGDQVKIKYRRARMRAATYARRFNYYLRTYPMMALVYLVLLQILVVYVLFFYQSSSRSDSLP